MQASDSWFLCLAKPACYWPCFSCGTVFQLGSVRSGVSELQVFDLCISEAPMAVADIAVVEVGRLTLTVS